MSDQAAPVTVVLTGDRFTKVMTQALQTSAKRTHAETQDVLKETFEQVLTSDLPESDLASIEESKALYGAIRDLQNRQLIQQTLQNFVTDFFALMREAAAPVPQTLSGEAAVEPNTPTEPSWKRLHELIGFKA